MSTLCALLDAGRPVMLIVHVSRAFFHAVAGGIIGAANEPHINTHAVIAVGYGTHDSASCILIRNSWGARWADQGYAWMHEQYLLPRLLQLGVMV